MHSTFKVSPATVTGRNLAHATRDAVKRAFLGVDIKLGIVALKDLTDTQISLLVSSSLPYQRAAEKVAAHPALRARVELHEVALMDAAKSLRPQHKEPHPAPTLFELFVGASAAERAECMRAFADEASEVLDDTTSPDFGPAMPDNGLFIQHHL